MRATAKQKRLNVTELNIGDTPLTATADELNALAGSGAAAADLAKLHAVTLTAAQLNLAVQGAAGGYKVARGVAAITGTGTITHGLASVVAVVVSLKGDPSLNATLATATWTGTTVTAKVWKPTAADDVTPIASTTATDVNWLVIGT